MLLLLLLLLLLMMLLLIVPFRNPRSCPLQALLMIAGLPT